MCNVMCFYSGNVYRSLCPQRSAQTSRLVRCTFVEIDIDRSVLVGHVENKVEVSIAGHQVAALRTSWRREGGL